MRELVRPAFGPLLFAASLAAACGGGSRSSPTTPTTPSPPPTTNGCSALGTTASFTVGIVNGTACSNTSGPVVILNLRDAAFGALASCSGTVISARAILTAGHCLSGAALVLVNSGSGELIRTSLLNIHPGYSPNDQSSLDVGVVLTEQDLGRPVMPVLTSRNATVGEQAVVAGWGQDENGASGTLRAGTTTVSAVGSLYVQTQYSGAGTSGVCHGDSGGPLLLSQGGAWAIAGITSATTGNLCTSNATSYYTSVRNPDVQSFVFGLVPDAVRR
jgi:hypothetical protein